MLFSEPFYLIWVNAAPLFHIEAVLSACVQEPESRLDVLAVLPEYWEVIVEIVSNIGRVRLGQAVLIETIKFSELLSGHISFLIVISESGRPVLLTFGEQLRQLVVVNGGPGLGRLVPGVSRDDIASNDDKIRLLLIQNVIDES